MSNPASVTQPLVPVTTPPHQLMNYPLMVIIREVDLLSVLQIILHIYHHQTQISDKSSALNVSLSSTHQSWIIKCGLCFPMSVERE